MTSRKLPILGLGCISPWSPASGWRGRQTSTPASESAVLYPALKKELDAVTAVRIVKAGGAPAVELKRGDQAGRSPSVRTIPPTMPSSRKLITSLADAKLVEEKTSKPESYATLGVEDISNAAAGGMQIEIDGPKQPVKLIVGKQGVGRAVRTTCDALASRRAGWSTRASTRQRPPISGCEKTSSMFPPIACSRPRSLSARRSPTPP